jgi:hypothetical protein
MKAMCDPNFKIAGGCCGNDRMVVGLTATYAMSVYHH